MTAPAPGFVAAIVFALGLAGCVDAPGPAADFGHASATDSRSPPSEASGKTIDSTRQVSKDESPPCSGNGGCGTEKGEKRNGEKACRDHRPDRLCPDAAPEPFSVPYDLTDCNLATAAIRIPIERAKAFLPEGYEPTDGGHKFGLHDGALAPVDEHVKTGGAVLVLAGIECAHVSGADGPETFAFSWIDIEPPSVRNMTPPSVHDGYYVMQFTSNASHAALLEEARLPVTEAEVTFEVTVPSSEQTPGTVVGFRIVGEDGELAEVAIAGAAGLSAGIEFGGWHQDPEGVTLTHLDGLSGARAHVGKSFTCKLASGSILAHLIGDTNCATANFQGLVVERLSTQGSISYEPGVQAEP